MTILEKIRNLPETRRKAILWVITIIVGLFLLFFYFRGIQNRIRNFKLTNLKGELRIPNFEKELKSLPKLEMPQENLEELKKIEQELQKNEEENQTSSVKTEQSAETK